MKRFALGFGLFLILLNISISAQDRPSAKSSQEDSSAVQATVQDYIEAYYSGDVPRMAQTLHPLYLKRLIHGTIPMREKTAAQMLRDVRAHGSADHSEHLEQISVLDVSGNIASAKLVTQGWVDYITLAKSGEEWKILSVVQQIYN
jgi:ketosteroid isomerase-like protein